MTLPAWGNPWRGKVQAGTISLPGGATKDTEQPQRKQNSQYDESGFTYLQRGPLASVARTADELAADAAAGRTWRTDAILSGASMHLYGKRLEGWVYCAPDGTRWHVAHAPLFAALQTNQALSGTLTLSRFGEFVGAGAQQSVAFSLAELGQPEPDAAYPAGTSAYLSVCDIRPDGSRALVMIYQPVVPFAQAGAWHPLHKRPLGWLELELQGGAAGITATLTVVRTRAQAFGSGTWSNYSMSSVQKFALSDLRVSVDKGDYYEATYTPRPLAASGGGDGLGWIEGESTYSFSFAGRILALWYDQAGALEEVTLAATTSGTVSNPPPVEVVSGKQVQHIPKAPEPGVTVSDDRVHTLTRTSSVSESYSVTLRRGGVVIDSSAGQALVTLTQTRRVLWIPGQEQYIFSRTESVTIDGVTSSASTAGESAGPPQALGSLSPGRFASLLPGNSAAQAAFRASDLTVYGIGSQAVINVLRYSNNLLALRRALLDYSTGVEAFSHGPAAIPGAADPGVAVASQFAVFGSYNPATQEVVRDQTSAVCWI